MNPSLKEVEKKKGIYIGRFSGDCDKMYPVGEYDELLKDNNPDMIYPLEHFERAVRKATAEEILDELEKHGHPMQGTWRRVIFQLRERYLSGEEDKK